MATIYWGLTKSQALGYMLCKHFLTYTFPFGIILDLLRSCKDGTDSPYIVHPDFSNVNILHNHDAFLKTKNSIIVHYHWLNDRLYLDSTSFHKYFYLPKNPTRQAPLYPWKDKGWCWCDIRFNHLFRVTIAKQWQDFSIWFLCFTPAPWAALQIITPWFIGLEKSEKLVT